MSLTKKQREHFYIIKIQKILKNTNYTDIISKKKFCDAALKYYSQGSQEYIKDAQTITGLNYDSTAFCPDNL